MCISGFELDISDPFSESECLTMMNVLYFSHYYFLLKDLLLYIHVSLRHELYFNSRVGLCTWVRVCVCARGGRVVTTLLITSSVVSAKLRPNLFELHVNEIGFVNVVFVNKGFQKGSLTQR